MTAVPRGIRRLFRPKTVLVLLFLVVVLEVTVLLIYWGVDSIVHRDLYRYGLIFDLAWAVDYWNSRLYFLGSLVSSIIFAVSILIPRYAYIHGSSPSSRWSYILFPVIPAALASVALYYVHRIDSIVHTTLYQYGLQFSSEWAENYQSIFRATLALGGAAIVGLIFMIGVIWVVTRDYSGELSFYEI